MNNELLSAPLSTYLRQFVLPAMFFILLAFVSYTSLLRSNLIEAGCLVAFTSFFAIVIAKESLKIVSVRLVQNELYLANALRSVAVPLSEISNARLSQDTRRGNTTINIEFKRPIALGAKVRFFPNVFNIEAKQAMVYRINTLAQTGHEPDARL